MRPINIRGGRVLLPGGPEVADVRIEDGRIAAFAPGDALEIDARGLLVAPGFVDIHGDAFERQVMPRPGVFFPVDTAMLDTDRQLAANGITTSYHALTLSWEPGLRSISGAGEMVDALDRLAGRLTVDNRIQLRWETFAFEAVDLIERVLAGPRTPALAFNDHTSMYLRPTGLGPAERPPDYGDGPWAALDDPALGERVLKWAGRAGMTAEAYIALLGEVWERRPEVPAMVERLAAKARAAGAPMLSHDDNHLETRDFYRSHGASIAEFPMTEPVARDARAAGEAVVLGAPNVVRGGSHIGSLGAADMIEAGVCTVLASDYFYPALLAAIARLDREARAPLATLWATVSLNPARALGLADRGEIAPGQRADVVLLDWPGEGAPAVRGTLSAGRIAYLTDGLIA